MLETTILSSSLPGGDVEIPNPQIRAVETDDRYGKFTIEPLERGYAITIGNAMRRVLLSSMPGSAITWVRIDGILHEYATVPHVKEQVTEFLLNVKRVRIRSMVDRPGKMRLEISGEGRICAGDISTSADFEIVNPELHLATIDLDDATLSVEFNVERGKGYVPAVQGDGLLGLPIGVLPVDAVFNPIRKVDHMTERTRIGNITDYERLVLEVWTDGTITPVEAVRKASEMLVNYFFLFSSLGRAPQDQEERSMLPIPPEVYQTPIEKLELSPRTLNCLKRAHMSKVGQVLETPDEELLSIRNFGEKSLEELKAKLQLLGLGGVDLLEAQEQAGDEEEGQGREEPEVLQRSSTIEIEEDDEEEKGKAIIDEDDDDSLEEEDDDTDDEEDEE